MLLSFFLCVSFSFDTFYALDCIRLSFKSRLNEAYHQSVRGIGLFIDLSVSSVVLSVFGMHFHHNTRMH